MLKKILIITTLLVTIFSTSFIFNDIISSKLFANTVFTEPCYSEIIVINGIRYLYEYDCDGNVISVTPIIER